MDSVINPQTKPFQRMSRPLKMTLGDMEQAKYAGSDPNRPTYQEANRTWPTPIVGDSKSARNSTARRKKIPPTGIHAGDTLTDAVTKWPTPTAQDAANNGGPSQHERNSLPLNAAVMYPSPDVGMANLRGEKSAAERSRLGGSLNPTWVEWLMGWPLGWTDLEPVEMDKYRQWCEQHGIC